MSNTKRESILTSLLALLSPVAVAAGGAAYRSREEAVARAEGTAIIVRPDDETVEHKGAYSLAVRDLVLSVEIIARGAVPDSTADSIVAAAHAAIMADPTLGNTVGRIIEETTKWDFEQADLNAVSVTVRYKVRYATPANTLTTST